MSAPNQEIWWALKNDVMMIPHTHNHTLTPSQSMSLNVGNAFGRAEQVSLVSMTTFPHWGQSTQLQFTKPYYRNLDNMSVHILSNSYISIFALSIFSLIR